MSKTKLELANEELESIIEETNERINELGVHTSKLYDALINIQELFDKIRNVPFEMFQQYQEIKQITLSWKQQVDQIESDYNAAQNVNIGRGAGGGALGVGVVTLGPAAAMGVATTFGVASTGTAISSLSGAAATNAALAWLGGGALAAGGGGIPAGTALLALAGPIGWTIAGLSILTSIVLFFMAKSDKDRLEELFLLIIERDKKKFESAIVELNERIHRIIDETMKLNTAIEDIALFGTDYDSMTEEQQYTLGSYKNLMEASTQLLVNPIKGLQPQFTIKKLNSILKKNQYLAAQEHCKKHKDLIVYIANLLYSIDTDESDRKLLSKSFRNNEEFMEKMNLEKSDLDLELFNIANDISQSNF